MLNAWQFCAPGLPVSYRVTLVHSVPLLAQLFARHNCAAEIGRDLVPFHGNVFTGV